MAQRGKSDQERGRAQRAHEEERDHGDHRKLAIISLRKTRGLVHSGDPPLEPRWPQPSLLGGGCVAPRRTGVVMAWAARTRGWPGT